MNNKKTSDFICLNSNYSTTKMVTKEKTGNLAKLSLNSRGGKEGGLRTKGYYKKSYQDKPLVTIITIVKNDGKNIEKTIQSVINQTYDNVEYIIIDGASIDGTLNSIRKYEDYIDYWISEVDEGIYDAMNKGILLAAGDTINVLNCGDYICSDMITNMVLGHRDFVRKNIIYCDSYLVFDNLDFIVRKKSDLSLYRGMTLCHQGMLIGKDVYKEYGLYSLDYKIVSDYEFTLRVFVDNPNKFYYINKPLVYFHERGLSSQKYALRTRESIKMGIEYFKGIKLLILFLTFFRSYIYRFMDYHINLLLPKNKKNNFKYLIYRIKIKFTKKYEN